jgi:hypothetical protein
VAQEQPIKVTREVLEAIRVTLLAVAVVVQVLLVEMVT